MAVRSNEPGPVEAVLEVSVPPWMGYLIAWVFLLLAVWLAWGATPLDIPAHEPVAFDRSRLSTAPRREILSDPPTLHVAGFERTCNDCHRVFPARVDTPIRLLQHEHIILNHGINDRCRNCHYEKDRNKLVLQGGEVIGYDQVVELCAKCHGPRYREWQHGAHGRSNGYWDRSRGELSRLGCTECHDPHNPRVPAMDPIEPLPAPHTLRMREPEAEDHAEFIDPRDPLRRHAHSEQYSQPPMPQDDPGHGGYDREDVHP